jgi:transcriptional regulator with XRE-family HTH domain
MVYADSMLIGQRLKEIREARNFSQGEIERRTGLLRCYTSRVENGHTVPSIETLEKYARALEILLYKVFYDGAAPPKNPNLLATQTTDSVWGTSGNERSELRTFAKVLARMDDRQRKLLLDMAMRMARHNGTK